ncbi:MAG: MarR family transcriptional regulator [Eubacteriaceae bacterium]|nr:MarR family transcriptional regulator [Eubacteriaceae bacterium]
MKKPKYIHQLMDRVSHMFFSRHFSLLERIDVHPGQVPLLLTVNDESGLSQKELANKLFVSAPTITVSMKRLENAGLIEKRPDEKDARIMRVYITQKGIETAAELHRITETLEEEMFEGFTVEEKIVFRRLLLQIRDNLIKYSDKKDFMPMKECKERRKD